MFLFIRNQIIHDTNLRRKRLMTLLHLFLIHRYKADVIQYMTPTDDNRRQTTGMQQIGIFEDAIEEIGDIIVAHINKNVAADLINPQKLGISRLLESKRQGIERKSAHKLTPLDGH